MDIQRRKSKQIQVGCVPVGGDAPISVQSMLVNKTEDIKETNYQITRLADAGCEIIRVAVLDIHDAEALKEVTAKSPIPVVADIHFNYKLALLAADNGASAIRVNPGNIGGKDKIRAVVAKCKERELPIRIGVNGGSVEQQIKDQYDDLTDQLVESAMLNIRLLEEENFDQMKISVKASDPLIMVEAYRRLAKRCDYPLHLGVTEAGTLKRGLVKSAMGIGMLLARGIGDTIRVSLTADSIEEVFAGHEILRGLGLREAGTNLVSCPSCGRCKVDLHGLASDVEGLVAKFDRKYPDKKLDVAVMGCFVNGPGEAGHADIGIAGGNGQYYIFNGEEKAIKVPENKALETFEKELQRAYEGKQLAVSKAESQAVIQEAMAEESEQELIEA